MNQPIARHSSSSGAANLPPPATTGAASFDALGLTPALLRAVKSEGYTTPTPVQEQAIPHVLAGRDVLACAQTGTGKTAAFVLPMLQRLAGAAPSPKRAVRALIVTPTRELAAQIAERITAYGQGTGLRHTVIYGGVGQRPQEDALRTRPEIIVATPGRLLDLMGQRHVSLDGVEILVLDEADRMFDMGFLADVRKIVAAVPRVRQTLLFSATMPGPIAELANSVLTKPVQVAVTPQATAAETVTQSVYFCAKAEKRAALERILRTSGIDRAIVFTRTKHGANRVAEQLTKSGIEALAIHGNKSQGARERALSAFRAGTTPVLVATDLAARGIDVDGVSHVVNYELPNVPEQYVHRIGRTGRAGAVGAAMSLVDPEERPLLRDIEKLLRTRLPVAGGDPNAVATPASRMDDEPRRPPQHRNGPPRGARPSTSGSRPQAASNGAAAGGSNGTSNGAASPSGGESSRRPRRRRYRGTRVG